MPGDEEEGVSSPTSVTELSALPVKKACELQVEPPQRQWLVRDVWARAACGVVGGQPKLGKSFWALDMAISVASSTPCLGRFMVDDPGPVLVYFAEDPLSTVRARIDALCAHRNVEVNNLDLYAIDIASIRLDAERDKKRLLTTVAEIRPRLLVLDPLVRMHAGDENSVTDISALLAFLTHLQRTFDCAVALVHHAAKKKRARPGQCLRGSSDLHAWGASNVYLQEHRHRLTLTFEHRAARAIQPMHIDLVPEDDGSVHFEIRDDIHEERESVEQRLLKALRACDQPITRRALRAEIRVNNQKLGHLLEQLRTRGLVDHTPAGWKALQLKPRAVEESSSAASKSKQITLW